MVVTVLLILARFALVYYSQHVALPTVAAEVVAKLPSVVKMKVANLDYCKLQPEPQISISDSIHTLPTSESSNPTSFT